MLSRDSSESDIIARVEAAENKITKKFDSGNVWVGQQEGKNKHGYGTFTYASGHKYMGEYKNNKRDGNGTYTDANGKKYVGEWKNDQKHGQGTFTFASGTIHHSGEWVNGSPKTKKKETKKGTTFKKLYGKEAADVYYSDDADPVAKAEAHTAMCDYAFKNPRYNSFRGSMNWFMKDKD